MTTRCPLHSSLECRAGRGPRLCGRRSPRLLTRSELWASRRSAGATAGGHRGYTIIEVLVSLAVVALLVTMLLPAMDQARSAARRLLCASNQRDLGLGVLLYADEHLDVLPPSVYIPTADESAGEQAVAYHMAATLRLGVEESRQISQQTRRMGVSGPYDSQGHDGLGLLYAQRIIPSPQSFYCPSHTGPHRFETYASQWELGSTGSILGNYQYRGGTPNRVRRLEHMDVRWGLISDSLRTQDELNHLDGVNVLDGTLAVQWFRGIDQVATALPTMLGTAESKSTRNAWSVVDGLLRGGQVPAAVSAVPPSRPAPPGNPGESDGDPMVGPPATTPGAGAMQYR